MWETVGHFESNFGKIPQFHGKWPFFAISLPFGLVIQEPASMLFSLLNLFTVIKMLSRFKNMKGIPNQKMWIVYAHIGVFTWISSSLFHMFDCDFTEKMDYLGAYTFVISAFYVSVIFMLPDMNHTQVGKIQKLVIQLFFITIFGKHMTDMLNLFDYGYNMFCCIIFSLFSTICYVYHLIKRKHNLGSLQEADILLIRIIVWANMATALELLDFVPVFWIFDSHSLFHLATIPIPIWWADFLDVTYEIDSSDRKRSILKMA
uniref:Post-GPI attachment to proteins factor 3 n=1 Tax=Caenorhabditis tropicalis TaxID=1561998 RepID=A0A1I7T3J2_9PELO